MHAKLLLRFQMSREIQEQIMSITTALKHTEAGLREQLQLVQRNRSEHGEQYRERMLTPNSAYLHKTASTDKSSTLSIKAIAAYETEKKIAAKVQARMPAYMRVHSEHVCV